jgi:hypothetical protein
MKKLIYIIIATLFYSGSFAWCEETERMEDNSFLIEEAYNQEAGVVQHIQSWMYMYNAKEWFYTFTQEWPVPGQLHQLSYSIPVSRVHEQGTANTGIGDVLLNYRVQAYHGAFVSFSPRLSLVLPTGNYKRGLGSGSTGIQANLPVSINLGRYFVTHLNAGGTVTPNARFSTEWRRTVTYTTVNFAFGGSIIWLAHKNFNLMLEGLCTSNEVPGKLRGKVREYSYFVNPGFRFAINHESGLQIVPGLSIPIGFGSARKEWGAFVYLSFEHEMWKPDNAVGK